MKLLKAKSIIKLSICALVISVTLPSCGPARSYWGVEQQYDIPGGKVYYGVGSDSHSKNYKKYYKEQQKRAKKAAKERAKRAKKAAKERAKWERKYGKRYPY